MGAFCASTAPSASTGPVRVGQDGSQVGGPCVMSSWTAASSDCSRPVNIYVHVKTADLYRPNARLTQERQGYQVLTPFGKLGYSQKFRFHLANLGGLRLRDMIGYVKEKARLALDGELANLFASRPTSTLDAGLTRAAEGVELSIQAINDLAAETYVPTPYPGSLTLFKPRVNYKFYPDPHMGWRGLALGGLDILDISVVPHAMLVEPYLRVLAAELKVRLSDSATPPHGLPDHPPAEPEVFTQLQGQATAGPSSRGMAQ